METMKRWFVYSAILTLVVPSGTAQNDGSLTFEDSDQAAVELLEDMTDYLESMEGITAGFSMSLIAPATDTLRYEGTLDQRGNQYHIDVKEYKIISDGTSRWVYYRDANEANLYNEGESEDSSSPLAYLRLYESGDFVIRSADEYAVSGQRCVELKPLDRMSEYSKVRLTLDANTRSPQRIEIFEKGGTRTDLIINDIKASTNFPQGHFVFNADDHPGVHIEDLRID